MNTMQLFACSVVLLGVIISQRGGRASTVPPVVVNELSVPSAQGRALKET